MWGERVQNKTFILGSNQKTPKALTILVKDATQDKKPLGLPIRWLESSTNNDCSRTI